MTPSPRSSRPSTPPTRSSAAARRDEPAHSDLDVTDTTDEILPPLPPVDGGPLTPIVNTVTDTADEILPPPLPRSTAARSPRSSTPSPTPPTRSAAAAPGRRRPAHPDRQHRHRHRRRDPAAAAPVDGGPLTPIVNTVTDTADEILPPLPRSTAARSPRSSTPSPTPPTRSRRRCPRSTAARSTRSSTRRRVKALRRRRNTFPHSPHPHRTPTG